MLVPNSDAGGGPVCTSCPISNNVNVLFLGPDQLHSGIRQVKSDALPETRIKVDGMAPCQHLSTNILSTSMCFGARAV